MGEHRVRSGGSETGNFQRIQEAFPSKTDTSAAQNRPQDGRSVAFGRADTVSAVRLRPPYRVFLIKKNSVCLLTVSTLYKVKRYINRCFARELKNIVHFIRKIHV